MVAPSLLRRLRAAALLVSVIMAAASCRILPDLDEAQAGAEPLAQTSRVFDRNGNLITSLHAEEDRVVIPLHRIPRSVQNAVVAIEDHRFWAHRGIDLKGILRAAYANAASGGVVEGGSTITQQYVKNRLLEDPQRTLERKVDEAALAWQYENEHSKTEILQGYLNTVYFGHGAYGIQRAAKRFFSRPATALRLPHAALLAGLIAGPSRWDPLQRPEAAVERRDAVLRRMLELGMINEKRYQRATSRPLGIRPNLESGVYDAPHFVDYVKQQILTDPRFGDTPEQRYNFLFRGGLRITTTIDLRMQRAAEQAVHGVLSVPGDPYGALTAVDPRNGEIRAMVGGRDYWAPRREDRFAKVNLATGGITGRQAGSAFKPFALVAALERGVPPTESYPAGSTRVFDEPPCGTPDNPWDVQNYEGSAFGTITMEQATVASVNVVYAQIIEQVGPDHVVETANRMGIRSKLRPYCSAVLGANEVNTMEMASAYGTLANQGQRVRPTAILRIENARGKVLYRHKPKPREAVNPVIAHRATQILQRVVSGGTGTAANIGRPQAGKTGTAQQWRDAWFVGYVPQLSAAVWVGWPQGQISMSGTRIGNVTGGSFPAQIWHAFMIGATERMPVKDFRRPTGDVVRIPIDITRGCVAGRSAAGENIRHVEFLRGSEPTNRCNVLPQAQVPSVIGMNAGTAYQLLQEAGFVVVQTIRRDRRYPEGTVLEQSPEAASSAEPGATISLIVSG